MLSAPVSVGCMILTSLSSRGCSDTVSSAVVSASSPWSMGEPAAADGVAEAADSSASAEAAAGDGANRAFNASCSAVTLDVPAKNDSTHWSKSITLAGHALATRSFRVCEPRGADAGDGDLSRTLVRNTGCSTVPVTSPSLEATANKRCCTVAPLDRFKPSRSTGKSNLTSKLQYFSLEGIGVGTSPHEAGYCIRKAMSEALCRKAAQRAPRG